MSPEMQYAMPLLIVPMQLVQLVVTVVVHWMLKRYSKPAVYALDELSMTYVIGRGGDVGRDDVRYQQGVELLDADGEEQSPWYRRHARSLQQHVITLVRYRLWPELSVSTVLRCVFLIVSASFTSVIVTCVFMVPLHCRHDDGRIIQPEVGLCHLRFSGRVVLHASVICMVVADGRLHGCVAAGHTSDGVVDGKASQPAGSTAATSAAQWR